MNDRATELVIQTLGKDGVVRRRAHGHWALSDEDLEQLLEAMLAECIGRIERVAILEDIEHHGGMIADSLREHFGVRR